MSFNEPIAVRKVDYWLWFYRLISWDSLLPVVIVSIPMVLRVLFPNRRGIVEIIGVVLPIIAFFIRYTTGVKHIQSNSCPVWMQRMQYCVFCISIFVLVLFDSFVILLNAIQNFSEEDELVLAVFTVIYFSLMALAMYPGRTQIPAENVAF